MQCRMLVGAVNLAVTGRALRVSGEALRGAQSLASAVRTTVALQAQEWLALHEQVVVN